LLAVNAGSLGTQGLAGLNINGGLFGFVSGTNTLSQNFTLTTPGSGFTTANATDLLTLSGNESGSTLTIGGVGTTVISGSVLSGSLTVTSTGTLQLTAANTYAGPTTITGTGAVIIASNTSSIAMTTLAAMTKRPDRFVGMHFMNPVPMMALVEVIRALQTSDTSFDLTMELSKKLGKTPVAVNDAPGFVSNRVLMPLINEAAYAVMEGVATPEAVDTVLKLGMNHPMGPLELADFIGLDVCVDIMHVLHEGLGDPKYRACPLLKKYVAAGYLGRKSNRGFYKYGG